MAGNKGAAKGRVSREAARRRAAALREAEQRKSARKRLFWFSGSTLVVIGVVIAIVIASMGSGGSSKGSGPSPAPASVVAAVTSVPQGVINGVGVGSATSGPQAIKGGKPPAGKPSIVYIGSEYCPFCAGERWAMVEAFSRFGTFSGLETLRSGVGEASGYNELPTFSFRHATYQSQYFTFTTVETEDRNHNALQTPTAAQEALVTKYDVAPYTTQDGAIPFIWFNDQYVSIGATYGVNALSGKTWQQVAAALKDATNPITKGIIGSANLITAALCQVTGNQPATVCTAVGVTAAAAAAQIG
jgi:hypothetical protein